MSLSERRGSIARLLGVLLVLTPGRMATAQQLPARARLPLEHWAVPFVEHLVRRQVITDPSPLMRPWRTGDVARALTAVDTSRLSRGERATVRAVLSELSTAQAGARFLAGAGGGLGGSSHQRRPEFEVRPAGPDRFTPEGRVTLGVSFGPAVLMMDTRWIEDLEKDPEWAGIPGRWQLKSDATYGLLDSEYLDVELGTVARNWGPPGFPGLLISTWPLSYDHLFVDVGPRRLHLSMLVTELDDAVNGAGQQARRYFIAHRLAATPASWLHLAAWQGTVFSGPNRTIELGFLNPMQFTNIARTQRRSESNIMLGGDLEARLGRVTLGASAFGDDFDFWTGEPFSFGGTLTASSALGPASVWLGYTLVSNLAYRSNAEPIEAPLIGIDPANGRYGTGLARNFADYDELSLKVSVNPLPGLMLTPELTVLRQGEGDPRLPFPPASEFPNTPTFLDGVVETTLRAAMGLRYRPAPGLTLDLSGGLHRIRNAAHLPDSSGTRGVGTVTVRYLFQFGGPLEP
jgi:hypothetical protein